VKHVILDAVVQQDRQKGETAPQQTKRQTYDSSVIKWDVRVVPHMKMPEKPIIRSYDQFDECHNSAADNALPKQREVPGDFVV